MSLVIISKKSNQQEWLGELAALEPDLKVEIYPHDINKEEVEVALVWHPPLGVFKQYPNLKWIASTGAGVDHILRDPDLPKGIRVTRIVDKKLTKDMSSYLTAQVMGHIRNITDYKVSQLNKEWHPRVYTEESKVNIGIMGMGELGQDVANKLSLMGFNVLGWARTNKHLPEINMFYGEAEFDNFLQSSNILICLLPLTNSTRNILNTSTFEKLPKGAFIINVARGEHIVDEELVAAIDSGHLSGACLDVFREEPLPVGHSFWLHPKITVTPHIASITSPRSVAPQVVENYRKFKDGQSLNNEVSKEKGY